MAGKIPTIISSAAPGRLNFAKMTASAVKQEVTSDRQVNDLQQAAQDATAAMRGLPYADGLTILQAQSFIGGANKVLQHRLGRAWRGYEVKSVSGNFGSFMSVPNAPTSLDAHQIILRSDVDCVGDVWCW